MQSYVVNSCTSLRLSKFKAKSTSSPMSTSATATATSTSNTNSSCSSNSSNTNSNNHNRNLASVILNSLLNDYSGGSMTLKFCNNNNNNNNSDQAIYWTDSNTNNTGASSCIQTTSTSSSSSSLTASEYDQLSQVTRRTQQRQLQQYHRNGAIRATTGLISCLFSNLRFLTLNAFTFKSPFSSSSSSSSSSSLSSFSSLSPLTSSQSILSKTTPLHLITAYSGFPSSSTTRHAAVAAASSSSSVAAASTSKVKFGDDAWFIAKQKFVDVLGVADGVGGWHSIGIDPSKFSSQLMRTCKRYVEQEFSSHSHQNNHTLHTDRHVETPIRILKQSYEALLESKQRRSLVGSSTACIILFHHDTRVLHTANLGDSGFVVIRDNRVIHKSQEQQHYFNSPFQMAILPSPQQRQNVNNNNNDDLINDSPDNAATSSIQLDEGDFIVVATDGLWDNLSEKQLLAEIANIKSFKLDDLEKAANDIASKAIQLAFDPDYVSPFALAARQNGININGGKPDDITVLLARVSK